MARTVFHAVFHAVIVHSAPSPQEFALITRELPLPSEMKQPPLQVAPSHVFFLPNATLPGSQAIALSPCVELAPLSVLGVATDTASEEFVNAQCSSLTCICTLALPLRYVSATHMERSPQSRSHAWA